MRMIFAAIGAVLVLLALASFFRSFWRVPPKRENSPDGLAGGVQGPDADSGASGHDGGGGHDGAGH